MNGSISLIKYHDGVVAGEPLWLELWTPGTTIIVKDEKEVKLIQSILKEFERMRKKNPSAYADGEEKVYLRWVLEEEYGW